VNGCTRSSMRWGSSLTNWMMPSPPSPKPSLWWPQLRLRLSSLVSRAICAHHTPTSECAASFQGVLAAAARAPL